jgi:hypothetical protein
MASRYLKIDPDFAYHIKNELKSSSELISNISQRINAYKQLRRKEIVFKNKLKVSFTGLKSKISLMESTFPEEERKIAPRRIITREINEDKRFNEFTLIQKPNFQPRKKEEKRDVADDLEEIRRKLDRFK